MLYTGVFRAQGQERSFLLNHLCPYNFGSLSLRSIVSFVSMCQVDYTKGEMQQKQIRVEWLSLVDFYFLMNSDCFSKSSEFQRETRSGFSYYYILIIEPYRLNTRVQPSHFADGERKSQGSKATCVRFYNEFEAEGQQNMPVCDCRSLGRASPKFCCFGILIILGCRRLKTVNAGRGFL